MRILASIFFFLTILAYGDPPPKTPSIQLAIVARQQIGVTTSYNPAYISLKSPNGDIPKKRGVCTDVVICALRKTMTYSLFKTHRPLSLV
ncbi:MAG: DUF1287 domain-containing protein [Akkermansiaceae bacterium]|nr:DUF1287 domain-containing protein [Akkermansiaceae bacterium]